MTTLMVHPLHGAMHAYSNSEIERLKGLGWSVEMPAVLVSSPSNGKGCYPVPDVVQFYEEPKRKPGRPPKAK